MKHLTKLVLVLAMMALLVGVAQAATIIDFSIVVSLADGPVIADFGETVSYTIYMNCPVDTYVSALDFQVVYDGAELEYLDWGKSGMPVPTPDPIPNSFMGIKPDWESDPDEIALTAMLGEGYETASAGLTEIAKLDFEVIADPPPLDGQSDCWVLASIDGENNFGIVAYDFGTADDQLVRNPLLEGADVGIPEPTTMALLGIGLIGTLLRKRS